MAEQFATNKWVGDLTGSSSSNTAFIIKKSLLTINGITVSGSYRDNDFVNQSDISYTTPVTKHSITIVFDSGITQVHGTYIDESGQEQLYTAKTSPTIFNNVKHESKFEAIVDLKTGYELINNSSSTYIILSVETDHTINIKSQIKKYTITYEINPGIKSIAVKHAASDAHNLISTDYSEEVEYGSYLDWFANAENGYTLNSPSKGTHTNITSNLTISPTATKEETPSIIMVQPNFASLSSDRRTVTINFQRTDNQIIPAVSGTITPPSSFPSITIDGHTFMARTVTVIAGLKVEIMSDVAYATGRDFTNVCVNPQPAFTIGGYTFQCDNTYGCTNNCTDAS